MQEIYPYFIQFHVVFSVIFLFVAVFISVRSFIRWKQDKAYGLFQKNLQRVFLSLLYIDLFLGVILYFFLQKPSSEIVNAEEAMHYSSLRFWAIQHFSNMIFVVILSLIGSMFISRTSIAEKKYKYSFIYFGVSTLIILVSVGLFALRK